MKVYIIRRNGRVGYDEYDSAVVVGRSPEHALEILQNKHKGDGWGWGGWNVTVTELILDAGVVLESFNAG